jgi:hypothetical protein
MAPAATAAALTAELAALTSPLPSELTAAES